MYRSFDQLRSKIEGRSSSSSLKETGNTKNESVGNFDQYEKYPLHILKTSSEKLPAKIDALKKEVVPNFISLYFTIK